MKRFFDLFPEGASTIAKDFDILFFALIANSIFFAVLIASCMIIFSVKYRRRPGREKGDPIHGNLALEIIWTIIPLVIAMGLFFWGTVLFLRQVTPPKNSLEMFVVGKQWMWKMQHPEGPREINELHVPINQPIKLLMTSEDVIHSFYVPAFRVKMDVVPGRYTQVWFEATRAGSFPLFCAEYCGTSHSQMTGKIIAMEPGAYQKWVSERMGEVSADNHLSLADKGEGLFNKLGCAACHTSTSTALGPNLTGLYGHQVTLTQGPPVMADEGYLRESILNPNAKTVAGFANLMPSFNQQIDEESLLALIAYIKSLGSESQQSGGE